MNKTNLVLCLIVILSLVLLVSCQQNTTGRAFAVDNDRANSDTNGDGKVDMADLIEVSNSIKCTDDCGSKDLNKDNKVNVLDMVIVGKSFT